MFQFIVGAKQIPMMIHSTLVAEQSHDLESLVNGSMQEASSGTVIWEDVEKETSPRFAQFVYTGDYDTPLHTTMGDPSQLPPLDKAEEEPTQLKIQHGRRVPESIPETLFKGKKTPKTDSARPQYMGETALKKKAQNRITVQSV